MSNTMTNTRSASTAFTSATSAAPQTATDGADFGATLRSLRLAKGVGLRQLARRIGISPTYLSQVERGDTAPPVEERVLAMAQELGGDPDELLALAGRIPTAVRAAMSRHPGEMTALIVAAGQLSQEGLSELIRAAESISKSAGGRH
ncbi:MAG: helix-turn-helix domain-containing protein [Nitrospirota bacterium]|nr:helix-turn-helix domain-containing protein [Nitrospirota bacterium]